MLKDLLATLKEAASQSEQRLNASQGALSQFVQQQSLASPADLSSEVSSGGSPGRSGGGKVKINPTGNKKLDAFLKAIADQESGGNYSAVGVRTKYGTAQGKYQILDSNINGPGGWDKEVLGKNISVKQFLNNPNLQEKIARGKLTSYYKKYGARGAAKAWYAGPGNANTNSNRSQYGGPSINDYAASVLRRMIG